MTDLETQKKEILDWVYSLKDPNVLSALLDFKESHEEPITMSQYDEELNQADNEIESGDFLEHQHAVNIIQQWRKH